MGPRVTIFDFNLASEDKIISPATVSDPLARVIKSVSELWPIVAPSITTLSTVSEPTVVAAELVSEVAVIVLGNKCKPGPEVAIILVAESAVFPLS